MTSFMIDPKIVTEVKSVVSKCQICFELVVSIGVILTFKVIFTPLEYIPSIPPL